MKVSLSPPKMGLSSVYTAEVTMSVPLYREGCSHNEIHE